MATVSRTNNISVMYIRNFLAMYDNLDAECLDVGTLCKYKAKNVWSKRGPINSNVIPRTDLIRENTSRWKVVSDNPGTEIVPNPPESTYNLDDFIGYCDKVGAPPININITKLNTTEQVGLTSYVGVNDDHADFTIDVFIPQAVDNSFPYVTGYKSKLYIHRDGKLGAVPQETILVNGGDYIPLTNEMANTNLTINCVQSKGLPYMGQTTNPVYHISINGGYPNDGEHIMSVVGKIYRQFFDDFSNPLTSPLYRSISFSDYVSIDTSTGLSVGDVTFDVFRQYVGDQTYSNGVIYITNLTIFPAEGVYLEYSSDGNSWTRYNTKITQGNYSSYGKIPPSYIPNAGYSVATYWRFTYEGLI